MNHPHLPSSAATDKDLVREVPNKLHFDFGGLNHYFVNSCFYNASTLTEGGACGQANERLFYINEV